MDETLLETLLQETKRAPSESQEMKKAKGKKFLGYDQAKAKDLTPDECIAEAIKFRDLDKGFPEYCVEARKDGKFRPEQDMETYNVNVVDFLDLPDSLLVKIFNDLAPEFMLRGPAFTCQKLYDIAHRNDIRCRINVTSFGACSTNLYRFLKECTMMESLRLRKTHVNAEIIELLASRNNLKHLSVENCIFGNEIKAEWLQQILSRLRTFHLNCKNFEKAVAKSFTDDYGISYQYTWLSHLSNVTQLSIISSENYMSKSIPDGLGNKRFDVLALKLNTAKMLSILGHRHISVQELKSLSINGKDLAAQGLQNTLSCLEYLYQLKDLEILWDRSECQKEAESISSHLKKLSGLESLSLRNFICGKKTMKDLFSAVTGLRRVDLESCTVNPSGLQMLARTSDQLEELRIIDCATISNYDLEVFIMDLENLKVLTLSAEWFVNLTRATIAHIEQELDILVLQGVNSGVQAYNIYQLFSRESPRVFVHYL